ncbi:spermatogenesis-associated protein 22 [Platysternon megacephalum]|uniref:Spermatogenesis-associated protein 22 n=1 Tax=Platysternon megacephalum TaxID=55544 RepID=A0A4D9ESG5_9SAUR|nr:spermatogenesis-associated protein 22 [Platysternon megacephalum]
MLSARRHPQAPVLEGSGTPGVTDNGWDTQVCVKLLVLFHSSNCPSRKITRKVEGWGEGQGRRNCPKAAMRKGKIKRVNTIRTDQSVPFADGIQAELLGAETCLTKKEEGQGE